MFSIDPYSGQITLEGLLDTNVSSSYSLVVEAHLSDGRFFNENLSIEVASVPKNEFTIINQTH